MWKYLKTKGVVINRYHKRKSIITWTEQSSMQESHCFSNQINMLYYQLKVRITTMIIFKSWYELYLLKTLLLVILLLICSYIYIFTSSICKQYYIIQLSFLESYILIIKCPDISSIPIRNWIVPLSWDFIMQCIITLWPVFCQSRYSIRHCRKWKCHFKCQTYSLDCSCNYMYRCAQKRKQGNDIRIDGYIWISKYWMDH